MLGKGVRVRDGGAERRLALCAPLSPPPLRQQLRAVTSKGEQRRTQRTRTTLHKAPRAHADRHGGEREVRRKDGEKGEGRSRMKEGGVRTEDCDERGMGVEEAVVERL